MEPFWITAYLDYSADHIAVASAFWSGASGFELSEPRGDEEEYWTLLPPAGDDFLDLQRLAEGQDRVHLDLHVDDASTAAARAVDLGAKVLAERGYVVLASPGGFVFCFVHERAEVVPQAMSWPGGQRSAIDQVCLDISAEVYDSECEFWRQVTGWQLRSSQTHPEFRRLVPLMDQPLGLLLQRLGAEDGERVIGAHLDLAATDRAAETARHVALGATVLDARPSWTVLADPVGAAYCITDRRPQTGVPVGGTSG